MAHYSEMPGKRKLFSFMLVRSDMFLESAPERNTPPLHCQGFLVETGTAYLLNYSYNSPGIFFGDDLPEKGNAAYIFLYFILNTALRT